MKDEIGVMKAKKFTEAINKGIITVDRRPNHGEEFYGAHEKQHREMFNDYLGSCSRYLSNKHMKEREYHGQ